MGDLFAPTIPPENVMSGRFRVFPIIGDAMEPLYRGSRDYALIAPVNTYQGDGIYLVDAGGGMDLFRVSTTLRGLRLSRENPLYEPCEVGRDVFDERVMGIVVADIRARDERFLREA